MNMYQKASMVQFIHSMEETKKKETKGGEEGNKRLKRRETKDEEGNKSEK